MQFPLCIVASEPSVEIELHDLDNPGHWSHFLFGQVGLTCKLNYPDVTRIFNIANRLCLLCIPFNVYS